MKQLEGSSEQCLGYHARPPTGETCFPGRPHMSSTSAQRLYLSCTITFHRRHDRLRLPLITRNNCINRTQTRRQRSCLRCRFKGTGPFPGRPISRTAI